MTVAAKGLRWFMQQVTALVVTDRLHVHAASFRQCADGQVVAHICLPLTPYHGTGCRVTLRRAAGMRSPLSAKIALVGGMLASIGASACCVGPLLLLSLGIGGGGIGNLTTVEQYR